METILNLLLTPIPISSQIPHREQGRTEKTGIDGENREEQREEKELEEKKMREDGRTHEKRKNEEKREKGVGRKE